MLLKAFASGSRGNFYEVSDGKTAVMLECGLRLPELRKLSPRPLDQYEGCLVTHDHKDHCRGAKQLAERGVDIFASDGTLDAIGLYGMQARAVTAGNAFTLGTLRVKPFDVVHDARQPVGFLIQSSRELLVFATDTAYMRYTFDGATEIAIECNFCEDLLAKSELPPGVVDRIRRNHFSLDGVLKWLARCDLGSAQRIHLIHRSRENGDADAFRAAVQAQTGVPTTVY